MSSSDDSTNMDLQSWTQQSITSLFLSSVDSDQSFESTFSPTVEISRNGQNKDRDSVKESYASRKSALASGDPDVKWENMVVVPDDSQNPNDAGNVGGFYTVIRSLKIRIRAGPAQTQTTVCFNARVEQDPSVQDDGADKRRIVQLVETVLDKPVPIHFQPVHQTTAQTNE